MNKILIIAEKPSVACDIAKTLGGFTKYDEYFESDRYVLSSAIGHLLKISVSKEYNTKYNKWTFKNLPIIPSNFILNPIIKTKSRLELLHLLIKRKDIVELINACDAGREGELIFRMIVSYTHAKQPIKRLWLQSMTSSAIRDGFANLKKDSDMLLLADAARSRSEADWLIGINGTRAMTAFNSKNGGFYLTTVGRVQTPTLSIVVTREEKIKKFIPKNFWEIKATFISFNPENNMKIIYEGKWIDYKYKKNNLDLEKKPERLWDKLTAKSIISNCIKKKGIVTGKIKLIKLKAPLLFNLTSLQREANCRFGFSAKNTLNLVQKLYEKYKVITYPRTDSCYLPEDYKYYIEKVFLSHSEHKNYQKFTKKILNKKWYFLKNKRIFNNSKVSDHFAIIPTTKLLPKKASDLEYKIYDLIMRRFIAIFFPVSEFQEITCFTKIKENYFKSQQKIIINSGWLIVYDNKINNKNIKKNNELLNIIKLKKVKVDLMKVNMLTTTPPARYTEATLLSAMEGAGKLINLEEFRDAMTEKGLGTSSTRASIIEGLISEKYLLREFQKIIPTAKAFQLMILLRGLGINELTDPALTGEWEYKLKQIEKGNISREEFMCEIKNMARIIVKRAKEYNCNTIPGNYITLNSICPNCKGIIRENYHSFSCIFCIFSINKILANRQFEIFEIEKLLTNHIIGPLNGFRSKSGRIFSAMIKIVYNTEIKNYKLEFDFEKNNNINNNYLFDFKKKNILGKCPICNGNVYEIGLIYSCENFFKKLKKCNFRSNRIILEKEILPDQIIKLLNKNKTDLLTGFISQRTKRSFKAFLVKDKNGKISFEFEKNKN
ncbi:DNA topoisomerase III [Candidatus Profftella armatura]|uniref:DNA topoisomerase n=1 Tax=Candidatus Profftella armatura TaxID=669502 RepID=S5R840_9PROT|nr:DNA topoisomerase III [Candidatus Profftella armatura]AGS06765.1 DNA topoisomerase III [Candidatus Profftella armatura]QLK13679.1 DNA topoisomerase III [Candidatus Profftella armatura]